MRWLAIAGLAALLGASGCSSAHAACENTQLSIASNAVGQSTPGSALSVFLASRMTPRGLPRAGWKANGTDEYMSGSASVHLWHMPNGHYIVDEARTC